MILTEDQEKAKNEIIEWFFEPKQYSDTDSLFRDLTADEIDMSQLPEDLLPKNYKTLMGYAGTGKTTLLEYVIQECLNRKRNLKIAVTAPTNKAVKVLVEKIKKDHRIMAMTVHSLLAIKPKYYGKVEKFEKDRYSKIDFNTYDLVIVDEASMISKQLLTYINEENNGSTKVLFCGDPAQIKPVNEAKSVCFQFNPSMLSQVVRHDDEIANKAALLRESVQPVKLDDLLCDRIELIQRRDLDELIPGFRERHNHVRTLCWTNARVNKWNSGLRAIDYGRKVEEPFLVGDILIANSPCSNESGTDIEMLNSQEGVITDIEDKAEYMKFKVRLLDDINEEGDLIDIRWLKPEFKEEIDLQLQALADAQEWKAYWKLRKFYHDVRHCYAMTTHKSQGSTFQHVIIDWDNICSNPDIEERNQLLYVAITRAAESVKIVKRR